MNILKTLKSLYSRRNSNSYIKFLRQHGITVGDGCIFRRPFNTLIDLQRPSLISIGNNVDMNKNFSIYTHDYGAGVFRDVYNLIINSSGAVNIGNNIYFGANVTVLKGVTIGDNCIIGAGSVVSRDIPSNSVAVGNPCKRICSLDEYFQKRKEKGLEEAVEYVKSIKQRYNRVPVLSDIREEYIYFVDSSNINEYLPKLPVIKELGTALPMYLKNHKALFKNFDEFITYCLNK